MFLHLNEILTRSILQLPFVGQPEPMPLIEADGARVLLQSPQGLCAQVFHRIFQQPGPDAHSLKDRLHKELLHLAVFHENEAFHDTVIPDPDVLQ